MPRTQDLGALRITCVEGFSHATRRPKFIGRNAKKDVHGDVATEPVVRIHTDQGIDGIGFGRVTPDDARGLVGKAVGELWDPEPRMVSSLGRADHALYDLVGKALGMPAWRLLGGRGPEWVPVYDTTLYFSDLLPEHSGRGVDRLVDELEAGLAAGFRAFKVKVGRGARWMDPEAGLARDVAVVRALAKAAPVGVRLMADANDQYGPETARRFLGEVGGHLEFLEEPFPESLEQGLALREWIRDRGLPTRLADGESQHDPAILRELGERGGLDILQPDIRALGLTLQCHLGRSVAGKGRLALAPHCWGSYLGTFKMLQLARGVADIATCEVDTLASDLFDDSAWELREGRMRVPDVPGCGLVLREDVYREKYLPTAWRVGA